MPEQALREQLRKLHDSVQISLVGPSLTLAKAEGQRKSVGDPFRAASGLCSSSGLVRKMVSAREDGRGATLRSMDDGGCSPGGLDDLPFEAPTAWRSRLMMRRNEDDPFAGVRCSEHAPTRKAHEGLLASRERTIGPSSAARRRALSAWLGADSR